MDGYTYTARFEAPNGVPILHAYPDPLTRGSPWTIGLGHTGPDVQQDTVWTEDHCWHVFYNDYAVAASAAPGILGVSTWALLEEPRKAALVDLCFNMGPVKLQGFHHMLDAIRRSDWPEAKAELLDSAYATEVKTRAETNATTLLTGEWPYE
jgi:GH24 family phage-related lysozyme (muramidase)